MKLVACGLVALSLLAIPAIAAAEEPAPEFSFNAAVTNDYVWRGFSQSDEDAAVQGGIDFTYGNFSAGTWASTVDFGDGTDLEWDFYAGFAASAGAIDWEVGVTYYNYVGDPDGSDYNFVEFKLGASHTFDKFTIGAAVNYSPDFYGIDESATYLEANAAYQINDRFSVSGGVGRQYLDVTDDYTAWNLGVGFNLTEIVALDVRYWDASVSTPLSDPRIAATLGVAF
ncbi:TorF family putative porin [uncultured Brevundimonas sp.]|uniref:TorF family putative porin n=1 Tax=uncultured Brevundimonas sp. TaxID=213418 RepID=UPI00262A7A8D|nr:TorF family putative porin [uncultured Brevundimonas sp.]